MGQFDPLTKPNESQHYMFALDASSTQDSSQAKRLKNISFSLRKNRKSHTNCNHTKTRSRKITNFFIAFVSLSQKTMPTAMQWCRCGWHWPSKRMKNLATRCMWSACKLLSGTLFSRLRHLMCIDMARRPPNFGPLHVANVQSLKLFLCGCFYFSIPREWFQFLMQRAEKKISLRVRSFNDRRNMGITRRKPSWASGSLCAHWKCNVMHILIIAASASTAAVARKWKTFQSPRIPHRFMTGTFIYFQTDNLCWSKTCSIIV